MKRRTFGWDVEDVPMSTDEFSHLLVNTFGSGAQSIFSRVTGISRAQANRYVNGAPIPKYVALLLRMLATWHQHGMTIPTPTLSIPVSPMDPVWKGASTRKSVRRQTGTPPSRPL